MKNLSAGRPLQGKFTFYVGSGIPVVLSLKVEREPEMGIRTWEREKGWTSAT